MNLRRWYWKKNKNCDFYVSLRELKIREILPQRDTILPPKVKIKNNTSSVYSSLYDISKVYKTYYICKNKYLRYFFKLLLTLLKEILTSPRAPLIQNSWLFTTVWNILSSFHDSCFWKCWWNDWNRTKDSLSNAYQKS